MSKYVVEIKDASAIRIANTKSFVSQVNKYFHFMLWLEEEVYCCKFYTICHN